MLRTTLLTTAALTALNMFAFSTMALADEPMVQEQTAFSQAVKSIKGWFGSDSAPQAQIEVNTTTAGASDTIQVPPPVDFPAGIEPAAGMNDDLLQVPPPYVGPQSDASQPGGKPRGTSFDGNASMTAFGDNVPSVEDIANMAPAAGEGTEINPANMDCEAILKAAENAEEGDLPDTALIETCESEKDNTNPAQPAFGSEPNPESNMGHELPSTQPAAGPVDGEPPIGGAVMPGQE